MKIQQLRKIQQVRKEKGESWALGNGWWFYDVVDDGGLLGDLDRSLGFIRSTIVNNIIKQKTSVYGTR